MYDRLVHLAFGLLLACMRELLLRVAKTRGVRRPETIKYFRNLG